LIKVEVHIERAEKLKILFVQLDVRPYSPDFNPIERHWFNIKNRIKKYLPLFNRDIFKAAQYAFQS